ncbi:septation protein SepH [Pimelobacter simplex]|uniref:septation protein SepH n=1 Tax=Nocardioides simplex TaxID=2045 RepID=UPI00214FDFA3|nr:septation protein SepH [Pimelobacter simplex]UUW87712.1 septation protein SepH [Pimelobacter simplex]UUW97218.1 septation protein SepH [Pimelobacter simplex]
MADQGGTDRPVRLTLAAGTTPRRLQLVDEQGTTYTLDITPELRTAVRGDSPRRLETPMSSSIRPREIQTRIRAGESAETVAEAAGTTVEAIMPYVGPVLAEREHVAGRAQKASVRRTPGEGTGQAQSRVLGDAVAAHLRGRGADPTTVVWDAYRRDTGRWVLTGTFDTDERGGIARFTYDAPGNYVLSDNDDARWLIGDVLPVAAPPARDDLQQVRERRLAAVPAEELPLGDAALPLGDAFDEVPAAPAPAAPADEPLRATAPESAIEAEADTLATPDAASDADAEAEAEAEAERARHRRPVQKKRGRASVPSWDEIMFGGGDQ